MLELSNEVEAPTLESERRKYQSCYAVETYHLQGARLERVKQDVDSMEPGLWYLDVGCGRAEMVRRATSRGLIAVGLELVPELCGWFPVGEASYRVVEGVVTDLPWDDDSFDYVSCYDMLEHLPENQTDQALDELFRVCRRELFLTTNNKQSRLGDLELHLTRMPRSWWNEKISARSVGMSVIEGEYGHDEWHWKIVK